MILADKAFELGFIELKLQTMKMIFYWKHEVNTGEVQLAISERKTKTKQKEKHAKKRNQKSYLIKMIENEWNIHKKNVMLLADILPIYWQ